VASLGILAAVSALAAPLWRGGPRLVRSDRGAIAVLVITGGGLLAAGSVGWYASPVSETMRPLAVAVPVAASVLGGGPVAETCLQLADPGTSAPGPGDPAVLHGGAWVGALERLAVAVTLLAGWPEGIAVTLAVKGLGRYPELRAPAAAERFIIGTFASVLWACGCAAVGLSVR
jgi:hypothetical protein